MFTDMIKSMKREWELTILGIMILIGFSGLVAGGVQAFEFFGGREQPPVPRVNVKPKFSPAAFTYLKKTPTRQLGSDHAMRLQIPQEWLNKKRYQEMMAKRKRDAELAEIRQQQAADALANQLLNEPPVNNKSEKPPEPIPPINHYMVYKGYMTSPKGETLAYLCKEDAQEEVVARTGASFLRIGGLFKGYTVKKINDEWLQLNDPSGKELTIIRGQRFSYGVTQNPDYRLEPVEPKTDDEATSGEASPEKSSPKKRSTGKKQASKSSKDPQQMIRDYLKKNGKNLDQKAIREAMKKNNISPEDMKKLLR